MKDSQTYWAQTLQYCDILTSLDNAAVTAKERNEAASFLAEQEQCLSLAAAYRYINFLYDTHCEDAALASSASAVAAPPSLAVPKVALVFKLCRAIKSTMHLQQTATHFQSFSPELEVNLLKCGHFFKLTLLVQRARLAGQKKR